MYFAAILLVVAGSVIYHLSIKQVPSSLNPFFSLAMSYGAALLLCLVGAVLHPEGSKSVSSLNWSTAGVAVGILGIELGFLLAYRAGWNVGLAALSSNLLTTLVLLPLGYLLFREQPSLARMGGVVLSMLGLWLMAWK